MSDKPDKDKKHTIKYETIIRWYCKDHDIPANYLIPVGYAKASSNSVFYAAIGEHGFSILKLPSKTYYYFEGAGEEDRKTKQAAENVFVFDKKTWSDFEHALVDYYATKTQLTLDDQHTLYLLKDGKEIIEYLRRKTEIDFYIVDRPWHKKILGFRSGNKIKMTVAVIGYIFLLGMVVSFFSSFEEDEGATEESNLETVEEDNEENTNINNDNEESNNEEIVSEENEDNNEENESNSSNEEQDREQMSTEELIEDIVRTEGRGPSPEGYERFEDINYFPSSYDEDSYIVMVTINSRENMTSNLTVHGFHSTIADIAEELYTHVSLYEVMVTYQMELVDSYGNTDIYPVARIQLTHEQLDQINFDQFNTDNIPQIAEDYWLHQVFSD